MRNHYGKMCIVLMLCVLPLAVCRADVFKGKVVNAETGEPIKGAEVQGTVKPKPEWSFNFGAETDSTGCFYLISWQEGRMLMTFSMIGYKLTRKVDYSYGKEVNDTTDLGEIKLQPTMLMLQEVEVKGHIPRITLSGDTVVVNPEAFKLQEGARLDELIRKLPGVQNREGKLYWNDKPIRLMMNGKDMFGGGAVLGELPAEVASKMKLYDKKSELSRRSGHDDGDEDNVLDIQVKPGFLDKWYGDVEAGYATKDRYTGNVRASRLSDHDPQMVYAQANSLNRYNEYTMNNGMNRNIAGDGKSMYGSYNYQHNWQTEGAMSNNSVGASANMGHSDGSNNNRYNTESFLPNTERTLDISSQKDHTHTLKPKAEAYLTMYTDANNMLQFSVNADYDKGRGKIENNSAKYGYESGAFQYHSLEAAMAAKPGDALYSHLITRERRFSVDETEEKKLSTTYRWSHYMGKKGSLVLQGATAVTADEKERNVNRELEYLREGKNESLQQFYDTPKRALSTWAGVTMNYWLTPKLYLNATNYFEYKRNREEQNAFSGSSEGAAGAQIARDDANTMRSLLHTYDNKMSLKMTYNPSKRVMIMPKVEWRALRESQDFSYGALDTAAVRISHIMEPSLLLKWKMSRVRNMDLKMAYTTVTPEMSKTMGFVNTTNPLWIAKGNPLLEKSHAYSATYSYHRMWLRQQIVLGFSASYNKDVNPISTLCRYNTLSGVYTTEPVNVKGGDIYEFKLNYDHGLGAYFRVNNQLEVGKASAYGYMTLLDDNVVPSLNHERRLGVNDLFEFTYETDNLQIRAFNELNWCRYRYSDAAYNSTTLYDKYGVSADWSIAPFEFSVEVADNYRSGYQSKEMNKHRVICEASVTYRFHHNKCRISLSADDIFNQDNYYWEKYSAYQRNEYYGYYLHHYLKLTFGYRFDAKTKK